MNSFFHLSDQDITQTTANLNAPHSEQAGLRRKSTTYIKFNSRASWSSSKAGRAKERARRAPKGVGSGVGGPKEPSTAGARTKV